ncbi:tetratricopeptide repeat protein [Mangrovimonas sp. YM274]|uniref:tetratricopeptide repeat protein n=1 Tax=Mangrovimonas sp. YM274 TaxID=3070660 RepID=UPI0027DB31CF|nr:tetratricopeptide repeat protein [Mangrovimonas sp. YM274]WMI67802.1 tetratricopeptide repeat protein [Mangrovimonas sp. YM274]
MATYKKRGYKPKTKVEPQEEEVVDEHSTTAEVFNTLDESASKTEEWAEKNQKAILVAVGAVALILLGYLGYNKFIAEPKAEEAMNDMFVAQQFFDDAVNGTEKDSLFTLALEGSGGKYGMVDIADKYSGTPAGNLANYYAGMAYLNLKDYKNAIEYLSSFSSNDIMLAPLAKGGIGDAFVQLNQLDDALGYYEQAINASNNEFTAPLYLFKAANLANKLGDSNKALTYFKRIKNEFPDSAEAKNIDVFIGRAEAAL